ncbi:MAG: aquaporin [Candidatus Eremiobacteraeota bacterium]|nr:aquaporin [Candidatus Eremiobacteraeota bacterium]MBV8372046.1 aquaporin [Candidatus Eremiobacteraeota bacterium]
MGNSDEKPSAAQKTAAEFIGTFIVTLAATCVDVLYYSTHQVDYVSRWLARGFITAVVIYALSEISGAHIDPAITLGFTLRRIFPPVLMLAYWVAQFAGAFAAAGLALAAFGGAMVLGASHPGPNVPAFEAVVCEVVLTAIVMLTILTTAEEKASVGKEAALAVGLAVAACGFFGGPISGASMNPARSIAPQILGAEFGLVWIYVAGPALGAALAVLIHGFLCGAPNRGERQAAKGK